MPTTHENPAQVAAQRSLEELITALDERKNFIFEAGAGAGKTFSLIKALHHLIDKDGKAYLKAHKKIACITYTNVAKDQIDLRTDKHPVVHSDTIHAFCWSMVKNFQVEIRKCLTTITHWQNRIRAFYIENLTSSDTVDTPSAEPIDPTTIDVNYAEVIGRREVIYQLGYPSIDDDVITLHHDDVLKIMIHLLGIEKFRKLLFSKYPVILFDEYQDTLTEFADALQTYFITPEAGPQIGFFGDHWQKIYGHGCGEIVNAKLKFIPKNANFRSVATVVNVLNKMRPALKQEVEDATIPGTAVVYLTNEWVGERRKGGHWAGDLPSQKAHDYLTELRRRLSIDGWDFTPDKTKVLMLTHNVLAEEQGYKNLADVFTYNESYLNKEDAHIAYFLDYLEPICEAFKAKKYGQMFAVIGAGKNGINSHSDKVAWNEALTGLLAKRDSGTIGDVLDYLIEKSKPNLPETIAELEKKFKDFVTEEGVAEPSFISRIRNLRQVAYKEVIALTAYINNHTPFATKHSIKGEEFENVLVVVGRGWNIYNFDQMLGWFKDGVPTDKQDTFERSRNLFYVVCSRPKKNLAVLFTQKVSDSAFATLNEWFGSENVVSLGEVASTLN